MMKPPKPPLSDDQVREIVRMHADKWTLEAIGSKFGRTGDCIGDIVHGKTYRHVTAPRIHDPKRCPCPRCIQQRRREENFERGQTAMATGVCWHCGNDTPARVKTMLSRPPLVVCAACRAKRVPR